MPSPSATRPPLSSSPSAAPGLDRGLCKGWITDPPVRNANDDSAAVRRYRQTLPPRRRCYRPLADALVAAGIGEHPNCAPDRAAAGMDEPVAAWLRTMTREGVGPDPWAAAADRAAAEAEQTASAEQGKRAAWTATALAELDRLTEAERAGRASRGPCPQTRAWPGDLRQWPPGTIGEAAHRRTR